MRLHRKQFVIARNPIAVDETWTQEPLAHGWILSYQNELVIETDRTDPENPQVVIGTLYCRDTVTGRGAGRYVRIRWPHVIPDPAALLAVHHGRIDSDWAVSSSPALVLRALTGETPPFDITVPLKHRGAINFIPMPGTRWHAVRRLFCDQAFDLSTGAPIHETQGIAPLASFEQALDTATEGLVRFAEELKARIPGTVYLPLTAGLDSRTVAAAFLAAGLPFQTITFRFAGKPESDVTIAAAISSKFNLRHHILELAGTDTAAGRLLDEHTAGAFNDWEISHMFPGNAYRYQRPGDAMIVAGCFELGRQYYAQYFGDLDFAHSTGADIWARREGKPGPAELTSLLDVWRDWRRAHLDGLDWSNAFYLDQRLSAWRATIEHGYDLLPAVVLHPANNAAVLSALVTPGSEDQRAGRLQHALIARLAPELARFPVNPIPLAKKLQKLRRRVQSGVTRRLAPVLGRRQ